MKAVVLRRAGSADHLALTEVADPVPEESEILVRVEASSVTRGDVVLRKMPRLVIRALGETPKRILGHEFAGIVERVGRSVSAFAVGDRVFGTTTDLKQGAHAEYVCVPESGLVTGIPPSASFEEAAPVPVGAMTALHFLEAAAVRGGDRVLVNGASGSVGSFAVQIAKHMGAHVTGVSSGRNADLVASLGADETIDHTKSDFTTGISTYDVIFDAVGKTTAAKTRAVLAPGGRFVTTQKRRKETVGELVAVRDLLASGSIRAVIDRCYHLAEVPEAHGYVERGAKRGNVLIVVGSSQGGTRDECE